VTITLIATPDPDPDYDPQTPIFARLMAERDHRPPGTLTEAQEEEMRDYAAQVAKQRDPQIQPSKVLEDLYPAKVPVVLLATKLPDPDRMPDAEPKPVEPPQEPEDAAQAAQEPQAAPGAAQTSQGAVTGLLERIDIQDSPKQAAIRVVAVRQGLDAQK